MKTQLLDQTLGDIFEEDGFNILDNSKDSSIEEEDNTTINISGINLDSLVNASRSNGFSNIQDIKDNGDDINNIVNVHENHVIKEFEPKEVFKQNESAWGDSLNKKAPILIKKPKSPVKVNSSFKPNGNLFKSQSFSKRNPRKSLSRQNSEISQGSNLSQNSGLSQEVLPDLETILSQKAREQTEVPAISSVSTGLQKNKDVLKEIDIGWLDRTSAENSLSTTHSRISRLPAPVKNKSFGLGNIDIDKLKRLTTTGKETISDVNVTILDEKEQIVDEIAEYVPTNNADDDDADEVVEESDNEEVSYRQAAKRRRVMPLKSVTKVEDVKEEKVEVKVAATTTDENIEVPKTKTVKKVEKRKRKVLESSSEENFSGSDSDSKSPTKKRNAKARKTGAKPNAKKAVRAPRVKKEKVGL